MWEGEKGRLREREREKESEKERQSRVGSLAKIIVTRNERTSAGAQIVHFGRLRLAFRSPFSRAVPQHVVVVEVHLFVPPPPSCAAIKNVRTALERVWNRRYVPPSAWHTSAAHSTIYETRRVRVPRGNPITSNLSLSRRHRLELEVPISVKDVRVIFTSVLLTTFAIIQKDDQYKLDKNNLTVKEREREMINWRET